MAWNLFPAMLALDDATGDVARNVAGQVFAPEDTARATPLPMQDATGVAITAAVSNRLGLIQKFRVENRQTVIWKSGAHEVEVLSIESVVADVRAAQSAAASSAASAATAAADARAAVAAQDVNVASFVRATGSETNKAVVEVAGSAGTGSGDVSVDTLPGATEVGKAVMKAVDKAAGRLAIGAGTSSLELGVLGTDAAAGNDVLRLSGTSPQRTTRPTEFAGGVVLADNALEIRHVSRLQAALDAAKTPAGVVYQADIYKQVRRGGDNIDGPWPTTRPDGNWAGMEWIGADPDPLAEIMRPGDIRTEVL